MYDLGPIKGPLPNVEDVLSGKATKAEIQPSFAAAHYFMTAAMYDLAVSAADIAILGNETDKERWHLRMNNLFAYVVNNFTLEQQVMFGKMALREFKLPVDTAQSPIIKDFSETLKADVIRD